MSKPLLSEMLDIQFPVIMAPMFLVTNTDMLIAAGRSGVSGAVPALNYRTTAELEKAIAEVKSKCNAPVGVNLIVNRSNPKFPAQLDSAVRAGVDYIITSLGNPKTVIESCKQHGIKVFCDVTDLSFAMKVQELGADAVIAVNNEAGGHAGSEPPQVLIPRLVQHLKIPVISAGGVGTYTELQNALNLGACGVSVGTVFIASEESPVSLEYKMACVQYSDKDIVMSDKISGTPCTVINTPFVQKIGTKQNRFEKFLSRNRWLKKWVKMFTFLRGMKSLENAAFKATYKTVWCAGPSIRHVHKIRPLSEIVRDIVRPDQ